MRHEISNVRRSHIAHDTTESIYGVKLAQGDYLLIETLITYLDMGVTYFYFDKGVEKEVVAVHPIYKNSYICTKNTSDDCDPLLNLPSF